MTKELGQKAEEIAKVKQAAWNLRQKEAEAHLKSQITTMCWSFCLRIWTEALNAARVDQSSKLRDLKKVFYPPTIRVKTTTPV